MGERMNSVRAVTEENPLHPNDFGSYTVVAARAQV
jgi:hypothetical protein